MEVIEGGFELETAAPDVARFFKQVDAAIGCDIAACLVHPLAIDEHFTGQDQGAGFFARGHEPAFDEKLIESHGSALGLPVDDEIGQLAQALGAFVERP